MYYLCIEKEKTDQKGIKITRDEVHAEKRGTGHAIKPRPERVHGEQANNIDANQTRFVQTDQLVSTNKRERDWDLPAPQDSSIENHTRRSKKRLHAMSAK